MLRRTWVAVCTAALVTTLAACGGGSEDDAATLTVGLQEPFSAYHIQVGIEQGFFEDVGIDNLETRVFTSVPAMLTAVAKGQLETGIQGLPALSNYNETTAGAELRLLTNKAFNTTHWAVSDRVANPVAESDDFVDVVKTWKGKKIGVPVLSGLVYNELIYMLTEAGLDAEKDVEIIAAGSGEPAATALREGLVDVIGASATTIALVAAGEFGVPVLEETATPSDSSMGTSWFTSDQQLEEDPELFEALTEGITRSKQFILDPANKDAVVDVLVDDFDLKPEVAEILYEMDRPGWDDPLNQETFQHSVEVLTLTGNLSGEAPAYDEIVAPIAQ